MNSKNKITVIGGGTGTFSVLSGLKKHEVDLTAIVSMADSGGSAKKERDELGLLPSSDIRKSLLALADISDRDSLLLRKLFEYRFDKGIGLSGMTFGNLFLAALSDITKSQGKAIKLAGKLLRIKGAVLPVSFDNVHLVARYEDGTEVIGEHDIDEPAHNGEVRITKLLTKPEAVVSEDVYERIKDSDTIIIGPGGFYTTVIANLVVGGVVEAISKSPAKKIFILNLMTEYGQTYGFSASTFIEELNKYLDVKNVDYVLLNDAPLPEKILKKYRETHAVPVVNDLGGKFGFKVVTADLLSEKSIPRQKGDTLRRSLIRHDPDKIAGEVLKLIKV